MSAPLPAFLLPVTVPASWLYGIAIAARNRRYDRGAGVQRVGVPVISVGNIVAGGAGKSPFVRWLGRLLMDHGHRPVIAMRGYRAPREGVSDEQAEHEQLLPQTDVLAQPDRLAALRRYLPQHPDVDCVLLDDGFQHRRLHRDLDLVLIDAGHPALNDHLLPAGYLREPASALRRADAVIITRAASVDPMLAERIASLHGRPPLAWTRHVWTGLTLYEQKARERTVSVRWLEGKRVLTMLGVARPQAILSQISDAGAKVAVNVPVDDHERYTEGTLERVRRLTDGLDAAVLTGKDWVKVRRLIDLDAWPVPLLVPELAIEVFQGAAVLEDLILAVVAPSSVP